MNCVEQLNQLEGSEIPIKPPTPCEPWTEEQILTDETNKVLQLHMDINSQTEKISLLSNRIKRAESKTDVVVSGPNKEQMKAAQEELGKDLVYQPNLIYVNLIFLRSWGSRER